VKNEGTVLCSRGGDGGRNAVETSGENDILS